MKIVSIIICLCVLLLSDYAKAQTIAKKEQTLPVIPVGWDAYRYWDQWPLQRIGVRAYMRSTHDRTGGNSFGDMSNFLFMKEENQNVTLDISGKGVLYFFRFNFWHGSPWHFIVDGKDNIVKETATDDPVNARKNLQTAEFIPGKAFPEPLAWTWKTTKGADLIWTPVPFEKSFRLAYSKTAFGTGYYIYHQYANEEQLSRPIRSWNMNDAPEVAVTTLLQQAGTDIAPKNITTAKGKLKLNQSNLLIKEIKANPSVIRALKFVLPLDKAIELERLQLKITWDGAKHASINAPLCLFFSAGTFYNRDNREYLVKGLPINIRYNFDSQKVELACYYPMPFLKSAKFELTGIQPGEEEIEYEIRYGPLTTPFNHTSYFHASYKDFPQPEHGKDLVLLDTRGIEGKKEWSGNFAGTSIIFSHDGILRSLEGDPRFFFDDSQGPQAYGTGTEEWGGGGFYWGGENMTLPLAGHPCGAPTKAAAKNEKDLIESCYRFLLADLMPFGRRAIIRLEHGGENLTSQHYETVTYWYGLPAPSLIKTDSIDIGNVIDEKKHAYYSPQSSSVGTVTSRFEWGIDTFPAKPWPLGDLAMLRRLPPADIATLTPQGYEQIANKEVYPSHSEDGRYTNGTSEFNVQLASWNCGVLLRRKLDYSFPNQKAAVFIAHINPANKNKELSWEYAGEWYLAGSNTYVFSRPEGELDPREYKIKTSNRRFRDDEFMIPAKLTKGQSAIRIRIQYMPGEKELYPGASYPRESAWSELKYDVYSYTLPKFPK